MTFTPQQMRKWKRSSERKAGLLGNRLQVLAQLKNIVSESSKPNKESLMGGLLWQEAVIQVEISKLESNTAHWSRLLEEVG